jgi:hypothetical protein
MQIAAELMRMRWDERILEDFAQALCDKGVRLCDVVYDSRRLSGASISAAFAVSDNQPDRPMDGDEQACDGSKQRGDRDNGVGIHRLSPLSPV